jgi:uncharacterized protein YyaL (SSP411 family)
MHRPVGFLDIVKKMKSVWEEQEERCVESAKEILTQLRSFANEGTGEESEATGEALELELLEESYQHFANRYDKINGGFSGTFYPLTVNVCAC